MRKESFRAANPAWTTLLGWEPGEVVGNDHLFFSHPEDKLTSNEALGVALNGPLPKYENRVRHRDGSYRWVSWIAAPEHGLVLRHRPGHHC